MTQTVSTMAIRAHIGEMLDRVALRHDEFIIERKGKPLAMIVPIERIEQMRSSLRDHALAFMQRQMQGPGSKLSEKEVMDLALEAQRSVRRDLHKEKTKRKRTRKS